MPVLHASADRNRKRSSCPVRRVRALQIVTFALLVVPDSGRDLKIEPVGLHKFPLPRCARHVRSCRDESG
jgi:hypothetical protein